MGLKQALRVLISDSTIVSSVFDDIMLCYYRPPHIKDLEALEPAFYNSLLWIQENDPEPLDLTFTVEEVGVLNYNIANTVGQLW